MRIRQATLEDLDEVFALETELFGADAWTREMLHDELTAPHREYVALEDDRGELIGYAGLFAPAPDGDVQTIAVSVEHRGRGFGRMLLEQLVAAARHRGVHQLFLEVRADNAVARALYESFGFEQIALRPNYYQPDGVDAIVMRAEVTREYERTPDSRH